MLYNHLLSLQESNYNSFTGHDKLKFCFKFNPDLFKFLLLIDMWTKNDK